MMRYVILGGNIAGTTFAETLRKLDPDAAITIIERDPHPCYSRVLLPHYVKGKIPREKLFLKQLDWYESQEIELMRNVEALSIDSENRFVATSEGREIPYDVLVVTTGGDVNTIPFANREVSYFRGIEDADQMLTLIRETESLHETQRRMVIDGAGCVAIG